MTSECSSAGWETVKKVAAYKKAPINKIEVLYAGRMIERRNGTVVRDLTTTETETGNVYVVAPVPEYPPVKEDLAGASAKVSDLRDVLSAQSREGPMRARMTPRKPLPVGCRRLRISGLLA